MNETFIIAWRSVTSERSGYGKKLMSREEAEALAQELNREYPAFIHEVRNAAEGQSLNVEATLQAA